MSRVQGSIRDADGNDALEGVGVRFAPLGISRVTGSDGRFLFQNVPPGEYTITLELLGYTSREERVEVEEGKILTLDLTLSVEPIELDPIEVSVEDRSVALETVGFYQRRQQTGGFFITREKIEERPPLYTTDLFRGMAGVQVRGGLGMGTQNVVILAGSRSLSFTDNPSEVCLPAVWVDGLMAYQGGPVDLIGLENTAFLDQLIDPEAIEGIEIYNSPTSTPVQYNVSGGCGVIIVWTRQGRRVTSTSANPGVSGGYYDLGDTWRYSSDPFPVDQGEQIRIYTATTEGFAGTFTGFLNDTIHVERIVDRTVPLSSVNRLEVRETRTSLVVAGAVLGTIAGIVIGAESNGFITGDHAKQGELLGPALGSMVGGVLGGYLTWKIFGTGWEEVPLESFGAGSVGDRGVALGLRIPWSP
jgi:hypothetical protein